MLFKKPVTVEQINTPLLQVVRIFLDNLYHFKDEDKTKMVEILYRLSGIRDEIKTTKEVGKIRLDLDKK